jgi:hypothetical protein
MKQFLTLILLTVFSTSVAQNIEDNLLLYYPFDGNAEDASGNEYHADEYQVVYVTDRHGNPESAIYFNGVNSYINFPNLPELKPDLPVSFSFWIKYEDLHYTNTELFNTSFEDDRSTGVYFNTQISNNKLAINYGDGSYGYNPTTRRTYVTDYVAQLDVWINIVAIVQSQNDMKIIVDCLDYLGNYSGTGGALVYSATPGSLGRRDRDLGVPANYFKGSIDDFRYWDRALNTSEILSICDDRLAVEENVLKPADLLIYPNPSKGVFHLKPLSAEFEYIQIFDVLGKEIYFSKFSDLIDLSRLDSGIYVLRVYSSDFSISKRIILN